jgi:shikimate kinase
MTQRNIVLFGFMATGKTTLGRRLAAELGLEFVDMDDLIVEREGKPIPRIFAEDGEAHFRRVEREVVRELSGRRGLVVATGGGVVLNADNVRDFGEGGVCVCLTADPETILQRAAGDDNRPLLAGDEKRERILSLLEARGLLYAAIPVQIDTGRLSVEAAAAAIRRAYEAAAAGESTV